MTKGIRWLVGGLISGLLLAIALFVGMFGGIWGLVGGIGTTATADLPTGVVTSVDGSAREVEVRFVADDGSELVDDAPWRGEGTLPDVGDTVGLQVSSADPTDVTWAHDDPRVATRFFRDAGSALLVVAAVALVLSVAALVATAVWASKAPPRVPVPGGRLPG